MTEKLNLRQLVMFNGMEYPTSEELIMLILGCGTRKNPLENLSSQILTVLTSSKREDLIKELMKIQGVGRNRALTICAALELGKRFNTRPVAVLDKAVDVVPYVKAYSLRKVEHFLCVTVTGTREVLSINVISVGAGNMAMVHPREIFEIPIREQASGVIFCHNHPGGNPTPSEADLRITERLIRAGELLGISVLDHIILGRDDYFSFLETGLLKSLTDCD